MLHPDTRIEYISDHIGHGIFATKLIPKGTVTWCLDAMDRLLTEVEVQAMPEILRNTVLHFSYRNQHGQYVVLWDASRFMNHSYIPNCMITPYNLEIAIRDIYPDEQLTCDYGTLNILDSFSYVGTPEDRSIVASDDLLRFHPSWDKKIEEAFQQFNYVEQPLASLIQPQIAHKLQAIIQGQAAHESILSLHYSP